MYHRKKERPFPTPWRNPVKHYFIIGRKEIYWNQPNWFQKDVDMSLILSEEGIDLEQVLASLLETNRISYGLEESS